MPQNLNQVPPEMDVWEVGGQTFLVRLVPDTDPPIPLVWKVSEEDKTALGIKKVDRRFSNYDEFYRTGAVNSGTSRELINTTEDPWEQIQSNYETEVQVKPWLADPEILSLWLGAALEGRSISEAEMQGTEWWRTHSESERQWLALNASDPASAEELIEDNRIRVADMFRSAGVDDASDELVGLVADNWTTGSWSQIKATKQIQLLADPFAEGELDPDLADFRGVDTTQEKEAEVKNMFRDWLGPAYSRFVDRGSVERWAGRLRNNPDAIGELETFLGRQFQAHYNPGGENYGKDAGLRYADIAPMWRNVVQQEWGQAPDETSNIFTQIIRMNDLTEAQKLLRKEGLRRNNSRVQERLLSEAFRVFGGQVRRSDQAVL